MRTGKTMSESKDIVVEFSGWVKISPQNIRYQYIGEDESVPEFITGVEWQNLSEEVQDNYIIGDVIAAIRDADDGGWEHLSTEVTDW